MNINQHSKQGGQIKVGEHLSLFVEDLSDDDDSIQMAELYEQFRKELETLQTKGQE